MPQWLSHAFSCQLSLLLLLALNPRAGRTEEPPGPLLAGAYAQEITPKKWPISVNGGMADIQSTAAHDPLHARCVVLKNSATSLAIVICDSCMLPRELVDRAKAKASLATGIPASNILIAATHAHSCPTATPVFQSDPNPEYVEQLIEQIAGGIQKAQSQLEPARIGWGALNQPGQLFNRRWYLKPNETTGAVEPAENPFGAKADRVIMNPGFGNNKVSHSVGLIDPELSFLSIQSREGRPIALLGNYSLHYVGGVPGNAVSADYFGEFALRLSRHLNAGQLQPPFVGIMSNGTSGDVNNVDFQQKSPPTREPFEQISYVAELLAQDVAKAVNKISYHTSVPLMVREAEISCNIRRPSAEEVASAEAKVASVTERPLKGLPLIYARETILLAKYGSTINLKLQAIRIGSLSIATSPCETFTETGLAIKKGSPSERTFTISLANGYNGYLPPPEQHQLGGYETWRARSSYLAADAEPLIRSTLLTLLKEVSQ